MRLRNPRCAVLTTFVCVCVCVCVCVFTLIGNDQATSGYAMRRNAADFGINLVTNLQVFNLLVSSLRAEKCKMVVPLCVWRRHPDCSCRLLVWPLCSHPAG